MSQPAITTTPVPGSANAPESLDVPAPIQSETQVPVLLLQTEPPAVTGQQPPRPPQERPHTLRQSHEQTSSSTDESRDRTSDADAESDTSDSEPPDDNENWQEDTSIPSEQELKEIEAGEQESAVDCTLILPSFSLPPAALWPFLLLLLIARRRTTGKILLSAHGGSRV